MATSDFAMMNSRRDEEPELRELASSDLIEVRARVRDFTCSEVRIPRMTKLG